ncbi:hypothetical protein Pyn_25718 [Prunus yedoensis var. nudiflora]|uniref:Uncharacterized protein n=1 Tax=Prunus yedoensis var. nudiflora TaxID=2094558 RepID=A0A314ZMF1_PRUYE|nr:hypothetical protein Pyn_25718 [Prunus yedoensis var. nudiflora]
MSLLTAGLRTSRGAPDMEPLFGRVGCGVTLDDAMLECVGSGKDGLLAKQLAMAEHLPSFFN